MCIYPDDLYVPFPITITFTLIPGGSDPRNQERVDATCPQWPGASGSGANLSEAAVDLLEAVGDLLPPAPAVVAALTAAGHGPAVIDAWDTNIRGWRLGGLRHRAADAVAWLSAYDDSGIPAVPACEFLAVGLSPSAAAAVSASGHSPTSVRRYVDALADFTEDRYGELVVTLFSADEDDLVDWILSEFDPEPAGFYARAGMKLSQAREWRPLVDAFALSGDDLWDIRRAGWTLADVESNAAEYRSAGTTIGDAARTILALQERPSRDWPPF